MSGAGIQPAALSPGGVGTPSLAAYAPGGVQRNVNSGTSVGARSIDPKLRQYVFDANGRTTGMSSTQQLVQLAVSTTLGSSTVRGLGQSLSKVDRITDNFVRRVSDVYTNALADLVSRKLIAITSIDVQQVTGTSRAFVVVKWTDLSTGSEEVIKL